MKLYELINPSDKYTFLAPNIEIAGVSVVLISSSYGAECIDDDCDERTPILFGWDDWLGEKGIDQNWVESHKTEIADCLESFLIGGKAEREDVDSMLSMLTDDKRQEWIDGRQERRRSSVSKIGEYAYAKAKQLRGIYEN